MRQPNLRELFIEDINSSFQSAETRRMILGMLGDLDEDDLLGIKELRERKLLEDGCDYTVGYCIASADYEKKCAAGLIKDTDDHPALHWIFQDGELERQGRF